MKLLILPILAAALFAEQPRPAALQGAGWQPLLNGRSLEGWRAKDPAQPHEWFTANSVGLDSADPKRLSARQEPGGVIVNGAAGKTQDWITAADHGDVELYVEWMVGKGSNSGVYLHGLYEVQVFDSHGKPAPKYSDAGGIYHRWINEKGVGGSSPRVNASRPAGEWQSFHIWFRAPRFDDSGKKTANARFLKVLHNGTLVQENVEVDGGTRAHLPIAEAPRNPLMLQGDHGPVAYRAIWWRPLEQR
jgi:hypothetical protein